MIEMVVFGAAFGVVFGVVFAVLTRAVKNRNKE